MLGLQIYHPEGDEIKAALNQLGVSDVQVNPANMRRSVQQDHGMCILLDTPKGRITISGDLQMTAQERPNSVAPQLVGDQSLVSELGGLQRALAVGTLWGQLGELKVEARKAGYNKSSWKRACA